MSNDLVKKLTSLAETAERSGAFTDEHRWILSDGVAEIAYEAADRIEALEKALQAMLHAVCHETGFAAAVRADSGKAYPWVTLDAAEEQARAALEGKDD